MALRRTPFFTSRAKAQTAIVARLVRVYLNGRKFGNSFLQFSDATLEIGHRGDTPFSAGLCASIKPHIVFGKILELDRTKDNLGSPQKFSSNPSKIFDELLPWRGKGAQIQIQEEIEIVSKPSVVVFFRPSLQMISFRHNQIMDSVGVGFVQQRVLAKQLAAVADIFIIRTRTAILGMLPSVRARLAARYWKARPGSEHGRSCNGRNRRTDGGVGSYGGWRGQGVFDPWGRFRA
jgi:hypothetical protein